MRLYYGTYGHHLSGKLYVYWGDDNLRTGEQVLAPVTQNGKTYNTMFTIARAQNLNNAYGEVERLENRGIFIKTIGGRDTLSLPSGREFDSKAAWKRDSESRYRSKFGLPPIENKTNSSIRTKSTSFGLPGGSAPKARLNSQLKRPINKDSVAAARNSLLARKNVAIGTDKTKELLRTMRTNKRQREK